MDSKAYLQFWLDGGFVKSNLITHKSESIFEVDYNQLKSNGVSLIIFDYDDTLADYHGPLPKKTETLLKKLIKQGFKIGIHSNFPPSREQIIQDEFKDFSAEDVKVALTHDKPGTEGFEIIFNYFNIPASKSCTIGDKVSTDLWGAFRSNVPVRILLKSYSSVMGGKKPTFGSRFYRFIENGLALIFTSAK